MQKPVPTSFEPEHESGWEPIGPSEDFIEAEPWPVPLKGKPVMIIRFAGRLYGLSDRCTHGEARLSDGWVEDGWVECPLHQGRFALEDGRPLCEPVTEGVRCVRVIERDGQVWACASDLDAGPRSSEE